jgi:CelD/BcsL family acetyltransferase involved in cellulose biosynthesis
VTTAAELGAPESERWERIRRGSAALASPFFDIEFTRAVGEVRRDVRIGVAEFGFFGFEVSRLGAGRPVGLKLSDYHGVVAAPEAEWEPRALLRGVGLRSYAFNHLPAAQAPFRPFVRELATSPVADLEADAPIGAPSQPARKRRRLARRAPLRFELHDPGSLPVVLAWKSAQYHRTGAFDVFSRPWVVEVVERLVAGPLGLLSTLRSGDELIAAHLGLRSGRVAHWWFPAYDPAFARDSPGVVLLLELLEAGPAAGITMLDFGKGDEDYKAWFANGAVDLGVGHVEADRFSELRTGAARVAWRYALRSPVRDHARAARRRLDFS